MFIDEHSSEFRVKKMCAVLSVSRSGYYNWHKRPESQRTKENKKLLQQIKRAYKDNRQVYGSPRITEALRDQGVICGQNRIARLMRENDIMAKTVRRFKTTTDSNHNLPVAPNLVQQNFTARAPNQLWTSDITYIWTSEGWLYLAVVLDVYARSIIGWATSARLTGKLVINALDQALFQRNVQPGLVFHSDRGSQFASCTFKERLEQNEMTQSMSAKGNCYDNAITESFFSTLKKEHVFFQKFQSRRQAHASLFEYIEIFYNRKRKHSAIEFMAPCEFEKLKTNP